MTRPTVYRFRLYVTGDGPYSLQAAANLKAICAVLLPNRHEIELIDVIAYPQRAIEDRVMLTPLLVKLFPAPMSRLVATLSDRESVLRALGLEEPAPDGGLRRHDRTRADR